MYFVWWICLLTHISRVCSQCSGTTSVLSVGYSAASVQSPNYDNGYSTDKTCSWKHSTSITGSSLLVQINASIDCTGDTINIYDGTDTTGLKLHTCSNMGYPRYFIASTGNIYTSFITDSMSSAAEKGFSYNVISAKDFSSSACTSILTIVASTTVQYISSPMFPNQYPINSECSWRIERKGDPEQLELSFRFIDIEADDNKCRYDYVRIIDDATGTTIITSCGRDEWFPSQTYTTKGNVTVIFHSDATEQHRGFLLAYQIQSSSKTPSDDETCYFNNCVILPVVLAIGGVILIAVIACCIMCFVGKMYAVPKTVKVSSVQKRPSFRHIFIPKFANKKQESKSLKNILVKMEEDSIISRPPIATAQTLYTSNDIIQSKLSEARKMTLKTINEKDKTIASSYTKLMKRNRDKHKELLQNSINEADISSSSALQNESGQLASEIANKEGPDEQLRSTLVAFNNSGNFSTTNSGFSKKDPISYKKEGKQSTDKRKTTSITRNKKTQTTSMISEGKVSVTTSPANNANKNIDLVKAKVKLKLDLNKSIESHYRAFFRKSIENQCTPNKTNQSVSKPVHAAELGKPVEKVQIRKMQTLRKLNDKRKEQRIKKT
ncbi:CUBN [Mytilus coruscus]|uniref:CUBN n=1 Tax=Mytilus coruscus TaxID=42192 RepID=A0A6J8DFP0_MYTCO|nr:CUBN [Mytilus coruscus]